MESDVQAETPVAKRESIQTRISSGTRGKIGSSLRHRAEPWTPKAGNTQVSHESGV